MCGIAGVVDVDPARARAVVTAQLRSLHHRGPDARGAFGEGRARIGQNQFAVPTSGTAGDLLQVPVTVSIGVAQFDAADSLQSLIERADRALYEAKNNGRNQVRVA